MKHNSRKDIRRAVHEVVNSSQKGARPAKFAKRSNFRKMPARIQVTKENQVHILCPFCSQPHDIGIIPATCGTKIMVYAIQETFRGQVCTLCGKSDTVTVKIGSVFRCMTPCRNDMTVYTVPPKKSIWARLAFGMPNAVHLNFAKKFGKVPVVLRNAADRVTGYAWQPVTMTEKPNDQTASG